MYGRNYFTNVYRNQLSFGSIFYILFEDQQKIKKTGSKFSEEANIRMPGIKSQLKYDKLINCPSSLPSVRLQI